MRLDKSSRVYINCRTQNEQEMMLDLFEYLGITWSNDSRPRELISYNAPMRYLVEMGNMWHGNGCIDGKAKLSKPIVEARDFRNQWISMKNLLDK